ncbi:glycosyl hydrolase [Anditalea andensis]|uniref:Glycosyl hydrolase n=2 Tax=Anditalea andensis TaxID=1048983 RepID=A0A074L1H0_9BACT|nr:glycosyl hydrolase [Anditalea andensis]
MIKNTYLSIAAIALIATACEPSNTTSNEEEQETTSTRDSDWIDLFDGESTRGWSSYNQEGIGEAWKVSDGVLHFDASAGKGGDLVTDEVYSDFHLELEWKISENGNSGILFYVQETEEYSAPYHTGPEMQILDNDGHPDAKITKHRSGDLYDLIESSEEASNPVGEWNKSEIISQNGKLDFYLNGVHTVSTTMWDDQWNEMVANSKFKNWEGFGKYQEGKIALQDHGDDVWFRNIRIKKL